MKISAVALVGMFAASTSAIELTPDNYDAETAGKTIFVKFFAPWCGYVFFILINAIMALFDNNLTLSQNFQTLQEDEA